MALYLIVLIIFYLQREDNLSSMDVNSSCFVQRFHFVVTCTLLVYLSYFLLQTFIRQECYEVVTGVLYQLLTQSRNLISSSVPTKPGPPVPKEEQKHNPMKDVRKIKLTTFVIVRGSTTVHIHLTKKIVHALSNVNGFQNKSNRFI